MVHLFSCYIIYSSLLSLSPQLGVPVGPKHCLHAVCHSTYWRSLSNTRCGNHFTPFCLSVTLLMSSNMISGVYGGSYLCFIWKCMQISSKWCNIFFMNQFASFFRLFVSQRQSYACISILIICISHSLDRIAEKWQESTGQGERGDRDMTQTGFEWNRRPYENSSLK